MNFFAFSGHFFPPKFQNICRQLLLQMTCFVSVKTIFQNTTACLLLHQSSIRKHIRCILNVYCLMLSPFFWGVASNLVEANYDFSSLCQIFSMPPFISNMILNLKYAKCSVFISALRYV